MVEKGQGGTKRVKESHRGSCGSWKVEEDQGRSRSVKEGKGGPRRVKEGQGG